jgi:hypothetical protein
VCVSLSVLVLCVLLLASLTTTFTVTVERDFSVAAWRLGLRNCLTAQSNPSDGVLAPVVVWWCVRRDCAWGVAPTRVTRRRHTGHSLSLTRDDDRERGHGWMRTCGRPSCCCCCCCFVTPWVPWPRRGSHQACACPAFSPRRGFGHLGSFPSAGSSPRPGSVARVTTKGALLKLRPTATWWWQATREPLELMVPATRTRLCCG